MSIQILFLSIQSVARSLTSPVTRLCAVYRCCVLSNCLLSPFGPLLRRPSAKAFSIVLLLCSNFQVKGWKGWKQQKNNSGRTKSLQVSKAQFCTKVEKIQCKFKLLSGKFTWGKKAKHCWVMSTNFWNFCQQCFAFTSQANFPTHNLNFHWRWRWWDWIQAIF